jgi:acyl-CoA dehydrogenase
MEAFAWIVLFLVSFGVLAYRRAPITVSAATMAALLVLVSLFSHLGEPAKIVLWIVYAVFFAPLVLKPVRRQLITRRILNSFRKVMPQMSETEQQALEAGTVGWTGELFSGAPDWTKLQQRPGPQLSQEEQEFLDGPTEKLCTMLNDWEISQTMTIPESIWSFLKKEGFFSMIIPKKYGGKEFSAIAHSAVISKVSGVSVAVATSIGVPNSLGPGELLLHYGTDEQQNHYLPRLASGDEIPCFALTSPNAGSDAGAIEDNGVICEEVFEGKKQLCIRLNWNKRYITLAPIATLLGLAFKLYDPNKLYGDEEELGITCALIPTSTKNVVTGRRHYPMGCAFPNGPTQGKDVIIPMDWIIGGPKMIGQGWRMLMECLAVGRSISLPSLVSGGSKVSALCSGAYARIRRQFNCYIGQFEGVQMALAGIAANTYALTALREFTVSSVDQGEKPVVESAISKYHTTEYARQAAQLAMDVHGGKAICMGPNNYLAQGYMEAPISITVEGANILTRSMIIFGQGAIRCHPYVLEELKCAQITDKEKALVKFDNALFGHVGFLVSNQLRSLVLSITGGRFTSAPKGPLKRYYQQFLRFSSGLALLADVSMINLGGALKRLENLSARLGDILSYLYTGSAVLKKHSLADAKTQEAELPVIHWICQDLLYKLQLTIHEFLSNFPNAFIAKALRMHILPLGLRFNPPSDHLTSRVARLILHPSEFRDHLQQGVYETDAPNNIVVQMNKVMEDAIAVEPLLKKLSKAKRSKLIKGMTFHDLVQDAVVAQLFTEQEGMELLRVNKETLNIINVDDFSPEEITRQYKVLKDAMERFEV